MAHCQLQKPAHQPCHNDTAHLQVKTHGEHKHSEDKVVTCQTQCQTQTYSHGRATLSRSNGYKADPYCPPNGHGAVTDNSHHHGHGAAAAGHGSHGGTTCHGNKEKSFVEKLHEGMERVKNRLRRKERKEGCGSSSSSESDAESDNESCRCPRKD